MAAVLAGCGLDLVFSAWQERECRHRIERLRTEIELGTLRLRSAQLRFQTALSAHRDGLADQRAIADAGTGLFRGARGPIATGLSMPPGAFPRRPARSLFGVTGRQRAQRSLHGF